MEDKQDDSGSAVFVKGRLKTRGEADKSTGAFRILNTERSW